MPKANSAGHTSSSRFSILDAIPTVILMTVLWWALTDGRMDSWVVGIPVIALASGLSLYLQAHDLWRWSLPGLLRFFPRFLWMSFRGGLEVAVPAFHPQRPLAPKLVTYRLRLPEGPARIFFTNATSLSPGTFSADLKDDQLIIHVLDAGRPVNKDLETLESMVAGLFGLQLSPEPPSQQEHDE
jgi:multicomponent Na+:H+ antiporter subunit E